MAAALRRRRAACKVQSCRQLVSQAHISLRHPSPSPRTLTASCDATAAGTVWVQLAQGGGNNAHKVQVPLQKGDFAAMRAAVQRGFSPHLDAKVSLTVVDSACRSLLDGTQFPRSFVRDLIDSM